MQSFIVRNRVVLLHVSFWFVYLSFNLYQATVFQRGRGYDWEKMLTSSSVQLVFTVAIAYLHYFFIWPRLIKTKNVVRYLFEFGITIGGLLTLRVYLQRYLADGFTHRAEYFYSSFFIIQMVAVTLLIVLFVGMLRFAVEWFELESKRKEIENEKLMAELNFLKAQINPHFLFNTLNNLYYLAYTKSDNTTEVIAKLSQMMRYMIYDSNHTQVLLSKEIEYMQNYISLERLRLNDQIPIKFEVFGNPDNLRIAPLVLITFLENAFKHGVSGNNAKCWVNVSIKLEGKQLIYTVENSKPETANGHEKSGIGLQNVKRRLDLSYPDQYKLITEDKKDVYYVQVTLTLS
ncbi:MAG TPA: histidine kinase [Cyclobacteriaceae bacterium]|jgi:two-component system sensor histidine kinase AlgZ|nr:histidine kinase [Cytophagales bacterium]HRE66616.1 histidine kinase [Cyclobacteriaceae bacterium]HRF35048.1 histidine kinase [Cyclobacteriaceae bacterium]